MTAARNYCRPECADPDFNECADCWRDGGNPALYQKKASGMSAPDFYITECARCGKSIEVPMPKEAS